MRVPEQIHARRDRYHADVVVRAGADAIEAKRAVQVAGFAREVELHFAAAVMIVSTQTIMSLATGANARFADLDFERRNQRGDKLELANGTNVFAEASAAEERINSEGGEEIVDD